jgi:hypothetical protein
LQHKTEPLLYTVHGTWQQSPIMVTPPWYTTPPYIGRSAHHAALWLPLCGCARPTTSKHTCPCLQPHPLSPLPLCLLLTTLLHVHLTCGTSLAHPPPTRPPLLTTSHVHHTCCRPPATGAPSLQPMQQQLLLSPAWAKGHCVRDTSTPLSGCCLVELSGQT